MRVSTWGNFLALGLTRRRPPVIGWRTMMDDDSGAKPVPPKPDLERLSIDEIEVRIAALEAEIATCREAIARKRGHRSDADGLFRR
jgi:uncharacterized small protein (DUF1192 family)